MCTSVNGTRPNEIPTRPALLNVTSAFPDRFCIGLMGGIWKFMKDPKSSISRSLGNRRDTKVVTVRNVRFKILGMVRYGEILLNILSVYIQYSYSIEII